MEHKTFFFLSDMYPLSKWEGGEIAGGGGGLVWCESIKICVTMSGAFYFCLKCHMCYN